MSTSTPEPSSRLSFPCLAMPSPPKTLSMIFLSAALLSAWPALASEAVSETATETASAEDTEMPGEKLFQKLKCHICHAVSSVGIERKSKSAKLSGADLAGIGDKRNNEWMVAFLKRQLEDENGEKHSKPFKGSDEELQAIVEWLAQLKDEAGAGQVE